jgi:hypothetical protein
MINRNDPNSLLAGKIVTALKLKGLIGDKPDSFKQLLIEGKAKDVDWKLALQSVINNPQPFDNENSEAGIK